EFLANLEDCGVREIVRPVRCPSIRAASAFDDGSIDFCFIDAAHDFESVLDDVQAWLPKVKPGGRLAGHDIEMKSVHQAVHTALGENWRIDGSCWIHDRLKADQTASSAPLALDHTIAANWGPAP